MHGLVAAGQCSPAFLEESLNAGSLGAESASAPAQGGLVLRSEQITELHFCNFRQNHNTITI